MTTCTGCGRDTLLPNERWVHRQTLPWHAECLRRDATWTRDARNEHALLKPGAPATYSDEFLATLDPEVARLAKSQHWNDTAREATEQPYIAGRTIGTYQRPQEFTGRLVASIDQEHTDDDGNVWTYAERLVAAETITADTDYPARTRILIEAAVVLEGYLLARLTDDERRVWNVAFIDSEGVPPLPVRTACARLSMNPNTYQKRRDFIIDTRDNVLAEHHAYVHDAFTRAESAGFRRATQE